MEKYLNLKCICDLKGEQSDICEWTRETRDGEGLWVKCKNCGLLMNKSGVHPDEARDYYNESYVKTNSFSKGEILSARQHFEARLESIQKRAVFLQNYIKKDTRIFELGAATGELLYLLKDKAEYCFGNEINSLYSAFMKNELQIDSTDEDYFKLDIRDQYNFIVAINTIDHIYDTFGILEKIYQDLKKGGYYDIHYQL